MKAKYINPFTDFGFKKIFGEEASKPLLIDFLNALLPHADKIVDLTFKNNEQLGLTDIDRKAIYDIYCENEKGENPWLKKPEVYLVAIFGVLNMVCFLIE